MSKKGTVEVFQTKITRNDRFAQMSHQEKVIEQKKREIQARMEQKQKTTVIANESKTSTNQTKCIKSPKPEKKVFNFNIFSNDGSFLNQFKQMKEKRIDQKLKSYKKDAKNDERKSSRWSQRSESQSKERQNKPRISRFNEKPNFEAKININTSYSNLMSQASFETTTTLITPQNVTGQPLLKNISSTANTFNTQTVAPPVIAAPPVLLNIPPPQVIQNPMSMQIVSTAEVIPTNLTAAIGNEMTQRTVLAAVTVPPPQQSSLTNDVNLTTANVIAVPPPCIPTIELSSIPPPNPIQVHNIPQPEPLNTLTIPPPAPLQVQNIPPPSPIHLNEIPNPKPLDILNIPTPSDGNLEKNMSDPDFIKNVPPPNKSVPPPSLTDSTLNVNVSVPPPQNATANKSLHQCLPPPNIIPPTTMPPPPQQLAHSNDGLTDAMPSQNILVHSVPPPSQANIVIQTISPQTTQTVSVLQNIPPPVQTFTTMQMQVVRQSPVSVANNIPSLMAQPILPPPGMGIAPPPINVNCPPPMIQNPQQQQQQQPIQTTVNYVGQLPPITNQMPPMNVPPPTAMINGGVPAYKDMNSVFPPGTPDYEAMASLGRMVAQCGPGIEEVVKQRKPQDPNLWFLFNKGSVAYRQYQQLVEQFKLEMAKAEEENYKPEDIYEPEMANDDENAITKADSDSDKQCSKKRRRKSRWGDKDAAVTTRNAIAPASTVMLSKVTRTDPALIQYAINTFGTSNLTDEDWKKAEDHYKINILYQDMLKKRQELERLQNAGKNKYDYDSDEDIEGGTWEHKLREKEMIATQLWAQELNRQAEGKHHIGDFLPPEELKRFLEKSNAAKEGRQATFSDYKEFKIKEDNIGFKMLQKLGWTQGQGLGISGCGITEPVNKASIREQNQGLGSENAENVSSNDDEYDAYRKRMMLAYRFRPNPLNNPRRPYY